MSSPAPRLLAALAFAAAVLVVASGCRINKTPPKDPCNPNPCTQTNKNQCVNDEGNALCLCNEGFVGRPSGACEPVSAANCPEHGGDTSEPDDCLVRAKPLAFSSSVTERTIEPAGDYDFFSFTAVANHVYKVDVKATGASLSPRVDIFDQAGQHLASAEGGTTLAFATKLLTSGAHFLRVTHSPLDPSVATGAYTISLRDAGADDHADGPDGATLITADTSGTTTPRSHSGRFEYGQDQDWFEFSASSTSTYRLTFDQSSAVPWVSLWTDPSAQAPQWTVQQAVIDFDVPQSGAAYIAVYPVNEAESSYSFTFIR